MVFEGVAGATEGPPAVFDSQARPQQARFHEESPSSATARLNGRMIAWLEHLQRPDLLSASWRTGIGSKTAAASETQAFASAQVDPRAELRHEASCHHTMQSTYIYLPPILLLHQAFTSAAGQQVWQLHLFQVEIRGRPPARRCPHGMRSRKGPVLEMALR